MIEQVLENRESLYKIPDYKSFSPGTISGIQETVKQLPTFVRNPIFNKVSDTVPFLGGGSRLFRRGETSPGDGVAIGL
jgi:hypothetical protein